MITPPRFRFGDLMQLLLVVALAAGLRAGYLHLACDNGYADPVHVVQGSTRPATPPDAGNEAHAQLDPLVRNLAQKGAFSAVAPLSDSEELTAHAAPGYYWLVAQLVRWYDEFALLARWGQCALGALTVGCLFFFARRVFDSAVVALVAGLLAALHPFWIVNTAELNDGVVTTFLLAVTLMLGARGSQSGGAFTSLLFGLSLAGLALVRAALLPFAIVALLWFLYHCRQVRYGWFNAIVALLGFANGLAPWAVRNWRVFEEPTPVVSSAYLHLWIGNNPGATGGSFDEAALRGSLPAERLAQVMAEPNQVRRYAELGRDVFEEISRDPTAAITRRWQAVVKFTVGDAWLRDQRMSAARPLRDENDSDAPPEWLSANLEGCLQGSLIFLMIVALLGWRWSYSWRTRARLATLALLWIPLPYLLSHAEELSGPRLPWDAVLICFAAYALASWAPSVAGKVDQE
jgi:4-amino-4-deoxy-L-arabinose transferase-like glycosyltransferase